MCPETTSSEISHFGGQYPILQTSSEGVGDPTHPLPLFSDAVGSRKGRYELPVCALQALEWHECVPKVQNAQAQEARKEA